VKLADFGVAAKLGELENGRDELQQNVVGTPYWMAPEVWGAAAAAGWLGGWQAAVADSGSQRAAQRSARHAQQHSSARQGAACRCITRARHLSRPRQVIEMTQVTAASDIWSVGCLILELLTGYPPYYDLQPMSALFRIVQVRRGGGGGAVSTGGRRPAGGRRQAAWSWQEVGNGGRPAAAASHAAGGGSGPGARAAPRRAAPLYAPKG
jgi:serine/threonine protein kinase